MAPYKRERVDNLKLALPYFLVHFWMTFGNVNSFYPLILPDTSSMLVIRLRRILISSSYVVCYIVYCVVSSGFNFK